MNLFCISAEELAADVASLSPPDRAELAKLPTADDFTDEELEELDTFTLASPESLPAVSPKTVPRLDARRMEYTGPFPRKRHYHKCPKCADHGSNGVNCYKSQCTKPVLMAVPCGWCR